MREVKKFLNKSYMSSLISLNNKNYNEIFKEINNDIILIDYFAPVFIFKFFTNEYIHKTLFTIFFKIFVLIFKILLLKL